MPKEQSVKNDYLEKIYNLHHICEALLYDGPQSAFALFKQRLIYIKNINNGIIPEVDRYIIITSLNRSIYDFFQFYLHISFTDCCYKNRVNNLRVTNEDELFDAGKQIIYDYNDAYFKNKESSNHLEKARAYIKSHLSEQLTLSSVGQAIHISSGYLSRIFSSLAKQSFCDYIRDERMALARQILLSTNLPVDEIASRCGFNTPNYFSNIFKKYMGESPAVYRKKYKDTGSISTRLK